jgi:acyl-coenzyme A synthetase/AMP-(fatty) acid ligase
MGMNISSLRTELRSKLLPPSTPTKQDTKLVLTWWIRLIKVKGMQVAPAELEAHLLAHPAVNDCVVIGVPSQREGEVPKAFVVKDASASGLSDEEVTNQILKHVEDHKSDYKRLRGGVEFIKEVPKSPSGKILRRLLRDKEREKMKKQGAKL